MFLHHGRLPHLLRPESYRCDDRCREEVQALFLGTPQCVASTDQLARPGDFLTLTLLGRPLQLRNVDGSIQAFSNVCAHRHCLLTSAVCGRSPALRCQYHGWEYDCDGRTARIPEPKNFAPFDRDVDRLELYRTETFGKLVFVTIEDRGDSLAARFGECESQVRAAFDEAWRPSWSWDVELPVNWKIPIENSLEGYHIPAVHPTTFKVAPDAGRTTHVVGDRWSIYRTPNVAPSIAERILFRVENAAMRILRRSATHSYTQFHFFPNLLISSTDMLSLATSVLPLDAKRTQIRCRLFTYQGTNPTATARAVSRAWSRLNRLFTKKVLQEDFGIYPAIQSGLDASTQQGCLGAIEERVHAFQKFVTERTGPAN